MKRSKCGKANQLCNKTISNWENSQQKSERMQVPSYCDYLNAFNSNKIFSFHLDNLMTSVLSKCSA